MFGALFQRTILDPYAGTEVGHETVVLVVSTYWIQNIPPGHALLTVVLHVLTTRIASLVRGLRTHELV